MRREVTASAPGKVILIGEHAVVYGRPALVAAIDLRAHARVSAARSAQLELELVDLGRMEATSWEALRALAVKARDRWRELHGEGDARRSSASRPAGEVDPARLVKVALGELAESLGAGDLPPAAVRVESQIPVGSGFGSSAAVAVAVLAAALAFVGEEPERQRLERLALEVERRQHGTPSGADHGAVLRGGILRVDPRGAGRPPRMRPLMAAGTALGRFSVFDSGRPGESTGEVVAAVRRRGQRHPAEFQRLLGVMAEAVDQVAIELEGPGEDPERMVAALRSFEGCLEGLGVVPEPVRRSIREIERCGAAAKVSGAGSLAGPGAGSVLIYRPPGARLAQDALTGWTPRPVRLGAEGVRLEAAA